LRIGLTMLSIPVLAWLLVACEQLLDLPSNPQLAEEPTSGGGGSVSDGNEAPMQSEVGEAGTTSTGQGGATLDDRESAPPVARESAPPDGGGRPTGASS
jgi:hypothetical protein